MRDLTTVSHSGQAPDSGATPSAVADIGGELFALMANAAQSFWAWLFSLDSERALWIVAAGAIFIALRFGRAVVSGVLRTKKQDDAAVRNVAARVVSSTWTVFLLVASVAIVAPMLALPARIDAALGTTLIVIGAMQAAVWGREFLLSVLVGYASRNAKDRSTLANAAALLRVFIGLAVWSVALLFILSNLGINVTALVAGLGVGGIAIGLAAQGIFSDLFSSLSIVLDKPFARGDFISFNGFLGTVERIGLKTTRVRALSGEQLVIANSDLLKATIQNYELLRERRVLFSLGVTYETPAAKVEAIPGWIEGAVRSQAKARFDRAHFKSYGDSALIFETVYFVLDADYNVYMDVQQAINVAILKKFETEGIAFAYPTRTVHVVSAAPA